MPNASVFDAFKAANFTKVRIPVRRDNRADAEAPYEVNPIFLDAVELVVTRTIERSMIAIINAHEDDFDANLPRFEALWPQVSTRFAPDSSDWLLAFEIYNEP
ncbi:hypothetical protein CTAYLR_006592 [Chrysophaeum taylorii]|uniref:Glycoside hydrolase family 5 domain-containing protein n=1 Tax=Chrysophaeum taylorii TaxID=2483200 RepID=A0AAD7XR35_9STRA|nr:hypothetical protein CTAYLR_006592 [Chrysophaeum taylorii]